MLKRLNELNFVIGLFFTVISLVLLVDYIVNKENSGQLKLYTGIGFLAFGLLMIMIKTKKNSE